MYSTVQVPMRQEETASQEEEPTISTERSALYMLTKLLLYVCIALQVVIWPSVMTITFACALALEGLVNLAVIYFGVSKVGGDTIYGNLTQYSVLLLHNRRVTTGKYIVACAITAYMLLFFVLFVSHEAALQPVQTPWLDASVYGQYSPGTDDAPLSALDVTGAASGNMRENAFTWPRSLQRPAVMLNGTLPHGGIADAPLPCALSGKGYQCFSTKLAVFNTPSLLKTALAGLPFMLVPFVSDAYSADAIITPPRGMPCSMVEVYRLTLDSALNVEHGLDYPASSGSNGSTPTLPPKCGVFGNPSWCLSFAHSFSDADYMKKVNAKCTLGDGQLVIRLPPRVASDVCPSTGKLGHDVLLVTTGATVQMRWVWHDFGAHTPLLTSWEQTSSAYDDATQSWRDASDTASVFLKYTIAVLPLQILWYYLTVSLRKIVDDYQVSAPASARLAFGEGAPAARASDF